MEQQLFGVSESRGLFGWVQQCLELALYVYGGGCEHELLCFGVVRTELLGKFVRKLQDWLRDL